MKISKKFTIIITLQSINSELLLEELWQRNIMRRHEQRYKGYLEQNLKEYYNITFENANELVDDLKLIIKEAQNGIENDITNLLLFFYWLAKNHLYQKSKSGGKIGTSSLNFAFNIKSLEIVFLKKYNLYNFETEKDGYVISLSLTDFGSKLFLYLDNNKNKLQSKSFEEIGGIDQIRNKHIEYYQNR